MKRCLALLGLAFLLVGCKGDRPCLEQVQSGGYYIEMCAAYSSSGSCAVYVPMYQPTYDCLKYGTPEP